MTGVQALLGFIFLLLGCLHFVLRDREPQTRSGYFGAVRFSLAARTAFALAELLLGATLLLTTT
jgi:hypothetical protein